MENQNPDPTTYEYEEPKKGKKLRNWILFLLAAICFSFLIWDITVLIEKRSERKNIPTTVVTDSSEKAAYDLGYTKGYKDGYSQGSVDCEDSLLWYKAMYKACSEMTSYTKTPVVPVRAKTKSTKPVVKKASPQKNKAIAVAPEIFKAQPFDGGKSANPISDDVTTYLPVYSGDFGTTTSIEYTGPDDAYLLYYLTNSTFKKSRGNASPPMINIGNGEQPMEFDQQKNLWYFIDYKTPLTSEMITASPCYPFSVHVGTFVGANFSYEIFFPHELIKPILTKVRGKEDGPITKEELKAMGAHSINIANGSFRPNGTFSYGSTPETKDATYYGWEVCGPFNYTVKKE